MEQVKNIQDILNLLNFIFCIDKPFKVLKISRETRIKVRQADMINSTL